MTFSDPYNEATQIRVRPLTAQEAQSRAASVQSPFTTPLPQPQYNRILMGRDLSGKAFSELGYRRNAIIYALVNLRVLALQASKLTQVDDNDQPIEQDSDLFELLKRPNGFQHWNSLLAQTEFFLAMGGVAYWYLARDASGVVREIYTYNASQMTPMPGLYSFIEYYKYDNGSGVTKRIEVSDIVRFTWSGIYDWDRPQRVTGPMPPLATLIDTDTSASNMQLALANRAGVPASQIELPPKAATDAFSAAATYSQGELSEFKQMYETMFSGSNFGSNMVTLPGTKVHVLGFDPKRMLANDFSIIPQSSAAQVFGVPLKMLSFFAANENQTYNSFAEARLSLYQDTMIPHGTSLTDTINHAFSQEIFRDGLLPRFKLDWSGAQAIMDFIGGRLRELYEGNSATLDEVRQANGLPEDTEFGGQYLWQLTKAAGAPQDESTAASDERTARALHAIDRNTKKILQEL